MRFLARALPALSLLLFAPILSIAATVAPPDDEARFLAGLPVPNSPLEPLTKSPGWISHAAQFNSAWAELTKRQLKPIDAWAPAALTHFYTDTDPLIYYFSGPDFLYAHEFFPNASTYVLCGIEPIGPLPEVENLPPQTLGASLDSLRDSLDSLLNFSFFITKKMKVELHDSRLAGTLPLIYIFLARTGCHIEDVSFTGIDPKGQITTDRTNAPAVKIVFTSPTGKEQTVYYFDTDLSDGPVQKNGFLTWTASLGQGRGFLKAASYLMHGAGFDATREFLLSDCTAILQDDSGIPLRFFPADDWDIHLFGHYSGPIPLFKSFPQSEFAPLTALQKPSPLPFSVGYRWHSGESSIVLAVKADHANPTPSPTPTAAPSATP